MQNLASAFADSARAHAGKVALLWGDAEFGYDRFAAQAAWLAHQLTVIEGVRPGDRVGLWLRNCPEFVPALFGILAAGAVVVPINNFLKPAEVAYMLEDAGIRLLVSERDMEAAHAELRVTHPALTVRLVEELPVSPETHLGSVLVPRTSSDLAVIVYTSGTTGRPKGAMLTHGNLLHNVASCREILRVVEFDRFILLLPMFHSFMLTVCVLLPLLTGGSIVLIRSLHPPRNMVAEIMRHQGTVLPAMAQVFRALAQLPAGLELPSLRLGLSGAGPLPAEILKAFNARHPHAPLIEGYGLSEASPVVSVNPIQGPAIAGTIGLPIPGVEIAVQDDEGRCLADGEDGEICVRGGNVMLGYWNAPEMTAATLVNGWLRTGDIGHRRPGDGYFAITDRKKDMLKPNGINVYPREIEEVIYRFPGVRECAVVGEPDERRGERPVAFVAMDEGVAFDERALLAFLRERLADYKLPRRAELLPALPRNATGKILKTVLRERVAGAA